MRRMTPKHLGESKIKMILDTPTPPPLLQKISVTYPKVNDIQIYVLCVYHPGAVSRKMRKLLSWGMNLVHQSHCQSWSFTCLNSVTTGPCGPKMRTYVRFSLRCVVFERIEVLDLITIVNLYYISMKFFKINISTSHNARNATFRETTGQQCCWRNRKIPTTLLACCSGLKNSFSEHPAVLTELPHYDVGMPTDRNSDIMGIITKTPENTKTGGEVTFGKY